MGVTATWKTKPGEISSSCNGSDRTELSMGVYSTECGRGGLGIIRFFFVNSRQDKEFLEKNAFFG